ncbi:MAG: class I SAM-dependent methyltransferase, partial [Deltaproteobacteria bacterium]
MIKFAFVQWQDYYDDAERYDAEVSFLNRDVEWYIQKAAAAGPKVLVCGCGTGRLVFPLAEAGLQVCGIDQSRPMLERALQKLRAIPENIKKKVRFVQADMRRFNLDDSFDCAMIPFNAVGHLHDEAQVLATFESVRSHLKASGKLLLDFMRPVPE